MNIYEITLLIYIAIIFISICIIHNLTNKNKLLKEEIEVLKNKEGIYGTNTN